jgi:hypothetical protein
MRKKSQISRIPQAGPPDCKLIRTRFFSEPGTGRWRRLFARTGIDFDAQWVQKHIAACPRCQRRFAHAARVYLALSLLKSRPMDLSLLGRANARAVGSLQHGVREVPKAQALKAVTPEPNAFERLRQWRGSMTQMAACLALMTLGKIGVFSSIQNTQTRGQQAMHKYYTNHLGQDLADEVFPPKA